MEKTRRILLDDGPAVPIDADRPHRLSFPAGIGDRRLAVRLRRDVVRALKKSRAKVEALLDGWLAIDVGGLGRIRPVSWDTEMHLELGTLSLAQATPSAWPGGRLLN